MFSWELFLFSVSWILWSSGPVVFWSAVLWSLGPQVPGLRRDSGVLNHPT